MSDQERAEFRAQVLVYEQVRRAYDLVAGVRERHHPRREGYCIETDELDRLAHDLYAWHRRLAKLVYPGEVE